jgi:hypothetical protein
LNPGSQRLRPVASSVRSTAKPSSPSSAWSDAAMPNDTVLVPVTANT